MPFLRRIDFPEFEKLVPQSLLRRDLMTIDEGTSDNEILEIIELIPNKSIQELIFDLSIALQQGHNEEAHLRLKLFRGDAADAIEHSKLFSQAIESGANSNIIVTLSDLPPKELKRLFDGEKFEDWMLFLHPDQQHIVNADFDSPTILKGVSGSGKTVVLLHRTRRLARLYPGQTIGVLTLNRTLANHLKLLIRRLCLDGEDQHLQVDAYFDYFQRISKHIGSENYLQQYKDLLPSGHPMQNTLNNALEYNKNIANLVAPIIRDMKIISSNSESLAHESCTETTEDTWRDFWRDGIERDENNARQKVALIEMIRKNYDIDEENYIRDEFTLIRSAFPLSEWTERFDNQPNSYLSYARKGRTIRIPERARRWVIRLLRRYEEYMLAGAMVDEMGLAQALFPSIKKLSNLPSGISRGVY